MVSLVAVVALLGALIGSFLNVVVWRLPRGESLVTPGSHCPSCGAAVAPYDNIPVLSWLLLRGRCRHCGVPISPRYPLIEALTAVVFGAIAAVDGAEPRLVLDLVLAAVVIAVAAIDLDLRLIPNKIVAPAAVVGVVGAALLRTDDLPELLACGAGAFVVLLAIALIHPRGMGMGDVKLAGVMGLYLGLSVLPALLVAFAAGSLVGLGIIATAGPEARKKAVPFGPFLALGAIVGILAGTELIDLYSDHFLS